MHFNNVGADQMRKVKFLIKTNIGGYTYLSLVEIKMKVNYASNGYINNNQSIFWKRQHEYEVRGN